MIGTTISPVSRKTGVKAKVHLESFIEQTLDYLRDCPYGATVQEIGDITGMLAPTVRKVLAIIAIVTSKVGFLIGGNQGSIVRLLLTHSPKGAITAACLEVKALIPAPEVKEKFTPDTDKASKPRYVMGPGDMAEVQRAWKLYKATCKAFRGNQAARLTPTRDRFPCLFTNDATRTGLLPTMALFAVARAIGEYATLGRLPGPIETPGATITFEGDP
jgi:hypothetical protein